jgi:hypothetical protein
MSGVGVFDYMTRVSAKIAGMLMGTRVVLSALIRLSTDASLFFN